MIISALLICIQSLGVAVSAEDFPPIINQLCEKEKARAAIYLKGTFDVPLPNTAQDITNRFSGVVARDGRYTLTESASWGTTQYWYDSEATYAGKEQVLEIDRPEDRAAVASMLDKMLNPANSTIVTLLHRAKSIKTVAEKNTTSEVYGHYEYLLSYEDSPDIRLVLTMTSGDRLSELRISEVNGYPEDSVITLGGYTSIGADMAVPRNYELRFEGAKGGSKASGGSTVMLIKLTEVSLSPDDTKFAPDRAKFTEVHDYRKGLRRVEKATGEWLDGVRDYLGF